MRLEYIGKIELAFISAEIGDPFDRYEFVLKKVACHFHAKLSYMASGAGMQIFGKQLFQYRFAAARHTFPPSGTGGRPQTLCKFTKIA